MILFRFGVEILYLFSWTAISGASTECKMTDLGTEYCGLVNVTISGRTCQRWDEQIPHKHIYPKNPENYCRNPDNAPGGPWCYTIVDNVRWEFCNIPYCDTECKITDFGKEYLGLVNVTITGRTCQRWDEQIPHSHKFPNNPENYCRNPDNAPGGPWCYTIDYNVRWEYCNIPYCDNFTSTNTTAVYSEHPIVLFKQRQSSSEQTTSSAELCPCSCNQSKSFVMKSNFTITELRGIMNHKLKEIEEFLAIDKPSTLRSIRRRTSAPDSRRSSAGIGFVAIIIICIPLILTTLSDCSKIVSTSKQCYKKK